MIVEHGVAVMVDSTPCLEQPDTTKGEGGVLCCAVLLPLLVYVLFCLACRSAASTTGPRAGRRAPGTADDAPADSYGQGPGRGAGGDNTSRSQSPGQ